jgi:hypothetical protein
MVHGSTLVTTAIKKVGQALREDAPDFRQQGVGKQRESSDGNGEDDSKTKSASVSSDNQNIKRTQVCVLDMHATRHMEQTFD